MFFLKYIGIYVVSILLLIGIGSFFSGIVLSYVSTPTQLEFPLADPSEIFLDKDGNIYCHIRFYQRIQVYNSNGIFVRGWHVPHKQPFVMGVTNQGYIVTKVGSQFVYFFDSFGKPVEEIATETFREITLAKRCCQDADGNRYEIRSPLLYPHIMKSTPDGRYQKIISWPLEYVFLTSPFWAWMHVLLGFVILAILQILQQKFSWIVCGASIGNKYIGKTHWETGNIGIPMGLYFVMELLSLVLGLCLASTVTLYFFNLQELNFTKVAIVFFITITGVYVVLNSIFSPICPTPDCYGHMYRIGEKPLRYRCEKCSTIYVQNVVEI